MSAAGCLKRTVVALIGLFFAVGFLLTALYRYVDKSPEAQERLELSAQRAELSINEDDSFLTKLGVLFAVWWNSDELVADARQEKEIEEKNAAQRRKEANAARFRDQDSHSGANDDYYGSSH